LRCIPVRRPVLGRSVANSGNVDPPDTSKPVPDPSGQQSLNPKRKQSNTTRKKAFGGLPAATAGSDSPQQPQERSNKRKRSNVAVPDTLKCPRMALFNVTANNSERKNRGKREVKAMVPYPLMKDQVEEANEVIQMDCHDSLDIDTSFRLYFP
jgi:hypothetical protein